MSVLCGQHATKCGIQTAWCGQHSHLHSFHFILSNFWKIFSVFSAFLGAKKHFFQKVLKKWSSIQKNRKYFYHFLGGEGSPQSDKNPFLKFFFKPSLIHYDSEHMILYQMSFGFEQIILTFQWQQDSQSHCLSPGLKIKLDLLYFSFEWHFF